MKKVAIVDMGTNTFHLLIANVVESGFNIIAREKVPVKIGVGGINQGFITPEGISRAIQTMQTFGRVIKEQDISSALAIGTSAFRNAHNGLEVANMLENVSGIECRIISGIEEANYIYHGVVSAVQIKDKSSLIIDIGGGSVEFIIGNGNQILWSHSFEIGGQRLLEKFQKHDPILPQEVDALNVYFSAQLKPLFDALSIHQPTIMVGSSGTFDTLSDIYCNQNKLPLIDSPESPFNIQAFPKIYNLLLTNNREGRMRIPGMIEMRVDMIVVACCLINFLLKNYVFKEIRVSSYSLKEGVLTDMITRNKIKKGS